MKVHGTIDVEVDVTEKEMVETMLARVLNVKKWKTRHMIIREREVEGKIGLYEEYDGSYHGSYSAEYSLITKDPVKIKKYKLLKELLEVIS